MFPSDFLWGAAAAGYQVERPPGNADWDAFVNTPEIVARVASFADRADLDVINYVNPGAGIGHEILEVLRVELDRARALRLTAYRFSVEWHRLQPTQPPPPAEDGPSADTPLNPDWLGHYLTVIKEILDREMTPVISLNHMSLPNWVMTPPAATRLTHPFVGLPVAAEDDRWKQSLRGWESDATVNAYSRFVRSFVTAVNNRFPNLAARRPLWLTLNEPIASMVGAGYLGAIWSPGFGGEPDRGKRVCLNLVKAHVRAYDQIKAVNPAYQVGFAHVMYYAAPTSFSSAAAGFLTGATVGAGIPTALGAAAGAVGGAIGGAAIGCLFGPLGCLIGLVLGAISGAIAGAVAGAVTGVTTGAIGGLLGTIIGGAQNVQQASRDQFDYFYNEWMLRALARGEVDTDLAEGTRRSDAEWDTAWTTLLGSGAGPRGGRLDFAGLNYYRRVHVYYYPVAGWTVPYTGGIFHNNMEGDPEPHGVLTELGWEVFPSGLSAILRRLKRDYNLPILVTENGMPEATDANRAPHLIAHLEEIHQAIGGPGAPQVLGYLHWTLVDNWEWHEGYNPRARFGLYSTGDRDPANSVPIGPTMTFRRQLTEGALALRSVIEHGDPALARTRFGAVAPGGERIAVATESNGALWEGQLGAEQVKLFLDTTAAGRHTGLIYYRQQNVWLPLTGIGWDAATGTLSFAHGSLLGVPPRSAQLTLDLASHQLTGTAQATDGSGTSATFSATRTPFHGVWLPQSPAPWLALAFHLLDDGDPIGKALVAGDGARWAAFRLAGTGATRTFGMGSRGFSATLETTDPRNLDVSPVSGPPPLLVVTRFRRARSSLAILGEP